MNIRAPRGPIALIGLVCLLFATASAQQNKTVIGPSNPDLAAGADALLAGDAEEGVRLTLRGLQSGASRADRLTGMSNLCAGYAMLEQYDEALEYCDRVLAENDSHWRAWSNRALVHVLTGRFDEAEDDLQRAEALAPDARTVQTVRAMLEDRVDPVAPIVIIDDRRNPGEDEDADAP